MFSLVAGNKWAKCKLQNFEEYPEKDSVPEKKTSIT